ncbi:MAG: SMC-Scp complex subunit ScpB [Anaerolineae bacterium]
MSDQTSNESQDLSLAAQLESILFVASGPVSVTRLAAALDATPGVVRNLLDGLAKTYQTRGLRLQWNGSAVQMTTAPRASGVIEKFLGLEVTSRLSQAALEVLAIIGFMQPVTRPQIDQIRGVNSDGTLRTLLSKGLIEEVGRKEAPGRPILYGTTPEFLQHFGLESLTHLPPISEAENGAGVEENHLSLP